MKLLITSIKPNPTGKDRPRHGSPSPTQLAGEWVDSTSGLTFESHNPADRRDIVGRFQHGTPADVASYELSPSIEIAWLAGGDHSYKPRERENIARAVDLAAGFIEQH